MRQARAATILRSDSGPFGSTVAKFISIALLHVFGDGQAGSMLLSAHAPAGRRVVVEFRDDGAGIALALAASSTSSSPSNRGLAQWTGDVDQDNISPFGSAAMSRWPPAPTTATASRSPCCSVPRRSRAPPETPELRGQDRALPGQGVQPFHSSQKHGLTEQHRNAKRD